MTRWRIGWGVVGLFLLTARPLLGFLPVLGCGGSGVNASSATGGGAALPAPVDESFAPVLPDFDAAATTFEGFEVLSFVPAAPRGIVFVFHGAGGSARFVEKVETVAVLNELVARGYGFVATESPERDGERRWDVETSLPAVNSDLARLLRLHASLAQDRQIEASTPVFAMGMSNGGAFASIFAAAARDAGLPVRAIALYSAPVAGPVRVDGPLEIPTFFVVAENDEAALVDRVRHQFDALARDGLPVELHEATMQPLDPRRFTRIPGVDEKRSRALFDELVAEGWADGLGLSRLSAEEATARLAAERFLPDEDEATRRQVRDQLAVVWALHAMRGDHGVGQGAFFDANL